MGVIEVFEVVNIQKSQAQWHIDALGSGHFPC